MGFGAMFWEGLGALEPWFPDFTGERPGRWMKNEMPQLGVPRKGVEDEFKLPLVACFYPMFIHFPMFFPLRILV